MNKTDSVLTGITTTGTPHLGNYLGAIKPAIEMSQHLDHCYFFLADYHALIKCQDPQRVMESRKEIAATWLAMGLNPENATFYRQSDIPEITELTWLLTCVTSKGVLNRAHAYKAAVEENNGEDPDKSITMGLFNYPILMAADILMFNANWVPVGKDQIQHIEIARDIAQRFNHVYGNYFVLPQAKIDGDTPLLLGLDGRKMSKSYDNTIPLFLPEKQLRKKIMKIVTNSLEPGEPKDPETSTLFQIYSAFASPQDIEQMRKAYLEGIAWGEAKQVLFESLNAVLTEPRKKYDELIKEPEKIEVILQKGAIKAREQASIFLKELRRAVGLKSF